MKNGKLATLSLDLDNKWSYLKTHGDPGWQTLPSYLDQLARRVLPVLAARDLKITFFVVGQDAALARNQTALQAIADAGHEIGNHSFNHDPWFHLFSEDEIRAELVRTEAHLVSVCGRKPVGYRGPGFSLSKKTLKVLSQCGYQFDCSTFPTFLGPLARAYYFMNTDLTGAEKDKRKQLFGGFREGLRSLKPYRWSVPGGNGLVEVPVTTLPLLKTPIHASYLIYLSRFSERAARLYFSLALWLFKISGTEPSLLLHPLDFLGYDDVEGLSFFPGMDLTGQEKTKRVCEYIDMLRSEFAILPLGEYVEQVEKNGATLPLREWR